MAERSVEKRLESLEQQPAEMDKLKLQILRLRKKVRTQEKQLQVLQDIEDIKRLQCAYGYYLEHWMSEEIIDCFAQNPEVSGTFVEGTYKGPEGIRRYFGRDREVSPEMHHMVMQVSPVITVSPDRKQAWGRWYGYGTVMMSATQPLNPMYMHVIYEMEYIKEDAVWKILKLQLCMNYAYSQGDVPVPSGPIQNIKLTPDVFAEYETGYPSGFIYPMHFNHPVTGKETSEAKRNARLKLKPSRYKPG
jgi:hypothetical protein